jgi:diguanylate cyclase (GGDEF)-like protein/PAS domain S-box-containing protein
LPAPPRTVQRLLDALYEGVYFVDRDRHVVFWNHAAEAITGFSRHELLGRSCAGEVLCHVDEVGRVLCEGGCPLTAALASGQTREARVFLRHREGHRVPVRVRVTPLRDSRGAIEGAAQVFNDDTAHLQLLRQLKEARDEAKIDPLTGLPNRRFLAGALANHLEAFAHLGWPLGVLMADIDHFKAVNDRFGHPVGDGVLALVSRTLAHNLRPDDLVGRWGGEEFLVLLPGADAAVLANAAERLRAMVARSSLEHAGGRIGVTVSLGGALTRPGDSAEGLIARADSRMYEAKQAGRDRAILDLD